MNYRLFTTTNMSLINTFKLKNHFFLFSLYLLDLIYLYFLPINSLTLIEYDLSSQLLMGYQI